MNQASRRMLSLTVACLVLLLAAAPAAAELSDVYLKNGLRLRADVTIDGDELIVRNLAGELRLPRADVERIVPVAAPPAATPPEPGLPPDQDDGQPATPVDGDFAPPPPLSKRDIQRLKMLELTLNGDAEQVRVRFTRKGKQLDLPDQVLEEVRARPDFRPEWEQILTRGQPHERLQLILRLTGTEHADRIDIQSDPEAFAMYRQRVLPLINRGCARTGCHAGKSARVFRFPIGSGSSVRCAYTSFVLLDQMRTDDGPLLNRAKPSESVLLDYLSLPAGADRGHPVVDGGPKFKPVIHSVGDRDYQYVLEWLDFLMVPHPDYELEYHNPYATPPTSQPTPEYPVEDGPVSEDEPSE